MRADFLSKKCDWLSTGVVRLGPNEAGDCSEVLITCDVGIVVLSLIVGCEDIVSNTIVLAGIKELSEPRNRNEGIM